AASDAAPGSRHRGPRDGARILRLLRLRDSFRDRVQQTLLPSAVAAGRHAWLVRNSRPRLSGTPPRRVSVGTSRRQDWPQAGSDLDSAHYGMLHIFDRTVADLLFDRHL